VQVQRLKDELRKHVQSSRRMEVAAPSDAFEALIMVTSLYLQVPETIDMKLVDPTLYAVLRQQQPELPFVHRPNRTGVSSVCLTVALSHTSVSSPLHSITDQNLRGTVDALRLSIQERGRSCTRPRNVSSRFHALILI
jgi:hypothetical protein